MWRHNFKPSLFIPLFLCTNVVNKVHILTQRKQWTSVLLSVFVELNLNISSLPENMPFSEHRVLVVSSRTLKFTHSYTRKLPPFTRNLHPLFSTFPPPTFPASFFFYLPFLLFELSVWSIRLSKQRCCTVPACYKYLWCVSPFISHPSSSFPSLREDPLFSFFYSFLLLLHRKGLSGARGGTRWQENKRSSCGGKKHHELTSTASVSLSGTLRGHSENVFVASIADYYSPLNSSISVKVKKKKQNLCQHWLSGEKWHIFLWMQNLLSSDIHFDTCV